MRLAVMTNAYPPDAHGGAGIIAAELVALWRASGHEVRVWASQVGWIKKSLPRRLFGHLWQDLGPSPQVDEVRVWKPDLVVTHNLTGVGWKTGNVLRSAGIPWVHVLHDVQLFEPSGQVRTDRVTVWQRAWAALRRQVFGVPTRVVSPTAWLLEAHARRGWSFSGAHVIPNPSPHRIEGVVEPKGAWAFVGRLSEDKGADFVGLLARTQPQRTFLCIGEGPLRPRLESMPNVRCLGPLPRAEVPAALSGMHGLLMPSRLQENQPTVLLEAFSAGVPVIASPRGGIPETVGEGGIVAEESAPLWAEAMGQLERSPAAWRQRARRRAEAFAPERVREAWEALFAEIRGH